MRLDFSLDKRLLQTANGSNGGTGGVDAVSEQAYSQALANAQTPEEVNRIIADRQRYVTGRTIANDAVTTAGKAELEANSSVLSGTADGIVQNGILAARNSQDTERQRLLNVLALFDQSAKNLMTAENSIEQTKAGFSGMVQILGIVAKQLGFEEFGQGCIELAEQLKPELVEPDGAALQAIHDLSGRLGLNPEDTRRIISGEQSAANSTVAAGQVVVNQSRDNYIRGSQEAPYVGPTGISNASDGPSSTGNGITKTSFASTMDNLLRGASGQTVLASEVTSLTRAFDGIAAQGGRTGEIDTATERASLTAVIRSNVSSQPAETRMLETLGLGAAPRPGSSSGF